MPVFHGADRQQDNYSPIPSGTIAKMIMNIRSGGYTGQIPQHNQNNNHETYDASVTKSDSGFLYLNCEFTVLEGPFKNRKVFQMIGLYSANSKVVEDIGRSFVQAMINSAYGIKFDDDSEKAMKARSINDYADLNGIEFVAKINIKKEKNKNTGEVTDKNIIFVIECERKEYAETMGTNTYINNPNNSMNLFIRSQGNNNSSVNSGNSPTQSTQPNSQPEWAKNFG